MIRMTMSTKSGGDCRVAVREASSLHMFEGYKVTVVVSLEPKVMEVYPRLWELLQVLIAASLAKRALAVRSAEARS